MTCILAASRVWNKGLIYNLEKETSQKFILLTDPNELTINLMSQINPEYIFFPHWSNFIPRDIFKQFECIIFHMTDLPFGRGGSPLQNLINRGIYKTKVTALRCEEEIDCGPIYLKKQLSLEGRAQDIYEKTTLIIQEMIVEIIQNKIIPTPQVGQAVNFARRCPEQSNIADLNEIIKVYDHIRMLDADFYPKAFIETDHLRVEFSNASLQNDEVTAQVIIRLKRGKICQQ